jgi:hypothetical protein
VNLNHKWTPAEVSQILFRNINSIENAINELINEDPSKLFKFSQMKNSNDTPQEEQCTNLESLLEVPVETEQKKKN